MAAKEHKARVLPFPTNRINSEDEAPEQIHIALRNEVHVLDFDEAFELAVAIFRQIEELDSADDEIPQRNVEP